MASRGRAGRGLWLEEAEPAAVSIYAAQPWRHGCDAWSGHPAVLRGERIHIIHLSRHFFRQQCRLQSLTLLIYADEAGDSMR